MKKQPITPKEPRRNLTPSDEALAQSNPALLRAIPALKETTKPDSVSDSERDRPEDGVDPTLPFDSALGAPGHKIKDLPVDDENEDGESAVEQMAEKGVERAEENTAQQGRRKSSGKNQ